LKEIHNKTASSARLDDTIDFSPIWALRDALNDGDLPIEVMTMVYNDIDLLTTNKLYRMSTSFMTGWAGWIVVCDEA
jgi:hypothetical protein